jgi:hypothetical protein
VALTVYDDASSRLSAIMLDAAGRPGRRFRRWSTGRGRQARTPPGLAIGSLIGAIRGDSDFADGAGVRNAE